MKYNIAITGMVKYINNQVAELLSDSLNMYYMNTDEYIAYEYTLSIPQLIDEYDEEFFYKAESKKLKTLGGYDNIVIGTSPSALISLDNLKSLSETAYLIVLKCTTAIGKEKIKGEFDRDDSLYLRNSLRGNYRVLEKNLISAAKSYADITINIDGLDIEIIRDKIIMQLKKLI